LAAVVLTAIVPSAKGGTTGGGAEENDHTEDENRGEQHRSGDVAAEDGEFIVGDEASRNDSGCCGGVTTGGGGEDEPPLGGGPGAAEDDEGDEPPRERAARGGGDFLSADRAGDGTRSGMASTRNKDDDAARFNGFDVDLTAGASLVCRTHNDASLTKSRKMRRATPSLATALSWASPNRAAPSLKDSTPLRPSQKSGSHFQTRSRAIFFSGEVVLLLVAASVIWTATKRYTMAGRERRYKRQSSFAA
jgi:hypothetical protein